MSDAPAVSLVCCDLANIAIDGSIVERAFAEAIATQGIVAGTQDYVRSMVKFDRAKGRPPVDVLYELFEGDEPRAQAASLAFDRSFRAAAERFGVGLPPDLVAVLGKIAGSGAKICLISALPRGASGEMLARLCRAGVADHALCADDSPRGFPWPDPVLTAMLRLGAGDVREVAVISATESGMQAGYRAGARIVAGIGEGSRRVTALRQAGATHMVGAIEALPDLVIGGG